MPPHRKHLESSGEEVIGGMAFAGIPDPHDCPGIGVLQSPSKHPPGLSLLQKVSCKKPVSHLFQQKNSVGPELLLKFQEEGRQLDFPTLHFSEVEPGPRARGHSSRNSFGDTTPV